MKETEFRKHIGKVLKYDKRLWYKDKNQKGSETVLLDWRKLIDLVANYDKDILALLFKDNVCASKFFVKVGENNYCFKHKDFQFFIEENKIDNSYTQYKNRIGLSDGKEFLKEKGEVVLNFPYKDCVLEGGQSTEEGKDTYFEYKETTYKDKLDENGKKLKEGNKNIKEVDVEGSYEKKQTKRKEIFFNEVLAADEIDRLFDKKALVNFKRHTPIEKPLTSFKRDETGTLRENLIIKGNNLLALHCLKSNFANKIKLIYIDPPYNTGGDANIFTYNNNFNHSTWLTFMKNRLTIAKKLLRDDGFIAIAIDHCELFYLGTLADEIFGRENRLGIVTVVNNPMGRNLAKYFSTINDYMLIYSKKKTEAIFNSVVLDDDFAKNFNKEDEHSKYKLKEFIRIGGGNDNLRSNKASCWYPLYVSSDLKEISTHKKEGYFEIYPITRTQQQRTWKLSKSSTEKILNDLVAIKEPKEIVIYEKYRINKGQNVPTVWSDKKYNSNHQGIRLLESLLGQKSFSYPKSLYTVLDTLKIMTNKDDIILDFHAGSGTTGHAVLALNKEDGGNRKFILVEQLDKPIDICKERIQKVFEKENIEDSFIYCEIAKWNEQAKEQILACESLEELKTFFAEMVEKYFLNYNLKIKEGQESFYVAHIKEWLRQRDSH